MGDFTQYGAAGAIVVVVYLFLKFLREEATKRELAHEKLSTAIDRNTISTEKNTELKLFDVEAISQPARVELLKTQIELFDLQKNDLNPVISAIENVIFELRQQEAKKMENALSQSEKELEGKHPLIQKLTRENIQYSRDLS